MYKLLEIGKIKKVKMRQLLMLMYYARHDIQAATRLWINVGMTLVHRLRRWTSVKPTLIQRLVLAGYAPVGLLYTKSDSHPHVPPCVTLPIYLDYNQSLQWHPRSCMKKITENSYVYLYTLLTRSMNANVANDGPALPGIWLIQL